MIYHLIQELLWSPWSQLIMPGAAWPQPVALFLYLMNNCMYINEGLIPMELSHN